MRKAKLYQLLAVAGGLSVAVASTPAWAKGKPDTSGSSGDSSLTAVPLNWTAGTATVDGDISEWDLDDASSMNKMCTGGKIDGERNCGVKSSVQLSTMYARYDCDTETMYVLVLEAGNYEAEKSANDSWVTSDGQSEKILKADGSVAGTQFAWVTVGGDFQGYEASFQLPANGTYDNVEVHLQVSGNTSSTGKFDNYTSSIVGLTNCEMPVVEDPVDEPTDPVDEPTDPVDEPTDPVDEPTDPVDEPTDPVDEPTDPVDEPTDPVDEPTDPVDEPTDPVACSEITGSNGVPMSVIAEYESDGNGGYSFVEDSGDGPAMRPKTPLAVENGVGKPAAPRGA